MNKRGVSPLIATVLLIAFAVALGAIVMNWGRGYVEDTTQFSREISEGQVECSTRVNYKINKVVEDQDNDPCDNNNCTLNVTVENLADKAFNGVIIRLLNEDESAGTTDTSLNAENDDEDAPPAGRLAGYGIKRFTVSYDSDDLSGSTVAKIQVIPRIKIDDGLFTVCGDKQKQVTNTSNKWEIVNAP